MKFLFSVLLSSIFLSAQAQTECEPYLPTTEGSTWEHTHYSKKDKVTGRTEYELVSKTESGDSLTFRIKATYFDDKDEQTYLQEYDAFCINGVFEFDMSAMVNGQTMAAYESMDVSVDATKFEVPSLDEAVGTALPDGSLKIQVSMNGVNTFKMTVDVTDRLVAARENMTTAAGTFDCVKISQTVNTRMIVKIQASSNEWYAEGVGAVRTESFDKKGRLTGYSILTSVNVK